MYTLHITLQDRKPLNERIIQIKNNLTFEKLAQTICVLYGFTGEHLREFRNGEDFFINHPDFNVDVAYDTDFTDPEFQDLQGVAKNVSSAKYKLSDYFEDRKEITFYYDFGENRSFNIKKAKEAETIEHDQDIYVISGTGSYLLEDSGGPDGLKGHLDNYAKQERDPDGRETREDFAERIQPAMKQFDVKKFR